MPSPNMLHTQAEQKYLLLSNNNIDPEHVPLKLMRLREVYVAVMKKDLEDLRTHPEKITEHRDELVSLIRMLERISAFQPIKSGEVNMLLGMELPAAKRLCEYLHFDVSASIYEASINQYLVNLKADLRANKYNFPAKSSCFLLSGMPRCAERVQSLLSKLDKIKTHEALLRLYMQVAREFYHPRRETAAGKAAAATFIAENVTTLKTLHFEPDNVLEHAMNMRKTGRMLAGK